MARKVYGTTWWGKKWLEALTGIDNENRIPRGLSYARNGKVFDLDIDLNHHKISAQVTGSYANSYEIEIGFNLVSSERVKAFMDLVAKDLEVVSMLTNRELSPRLFDIATSCNLQIFPTSWRDLHMKCSCPDYAVPCKHLAAVIYEASQLFDANPELIFKLIGIDLQAELEARQVFAVGASSSREVPKFHDRYLQSLIGSEQLKKLASEYDVELNLVTLDDHEAKILYQDPQLITYDPAKDGVIFDEQLREAFKSQHEQQELVQNYAHTMAQVAEEIEACKANINEKDLLFSKVAKQFNTLQKKRTLSYYEQARFNSYTKIQQDLEREKTRLQELLVRHAQLNVQKIDAQNKFDEICLNNKQAFATQLAKQQEQLRLGYDLQAEQARLEQESQDLAERTAKAQHIAEEQDAAKSFISELDAIDNGDDGSNSQELAALDATGATGATRVTSGAEAGTDGAGAEIGGDAGDGLKVRRYKGSIEQLEQLTYELQINDLSSAILQLFSENAAGYAEGNLRKQVDDTLAVAAKLATRQLNNFQDRDLVVFAYDKPLNLGDGTAESAVVVAEVPPEEAKTEAVTAEAQESQESQEEVVELNDLAQEVNAVTLKKTKEVASAKDVAKDQEATTSVEPTVPAKEVVAKVVGLVENTSKFIPRGKRQLESAVAALGQDYRECIDRFYAALIPFLKVNIALSHYVPKPGIKPRAIVEATKQEQELMLQLLFWQALRLALLGIKLPAERFEQELQAQVYASVLYALENFSGLGDFLSRKPERAQDTAFLEEHFTEVLGIKGWIQKKIAERIDLGFDASILSCKFLDMYLGRLLMANNPDLSATCVMGAWSFLISWRNEVDVADDEHQKAVFKELLQYAVKHPLKVQTAGGEDTGKEDAGILAGGNGGAEPTVSEESTEPSKRGRRGRKARMDDTDGTTSTGVKKLELEQLKQPEQIEQSEQPTALTKKPKDATASSKQAVLDAAARGQFDSASESFKPWVVDPRDLKVFAKADPIYHEAAEILWKGERFPKAELEQIKILQKGEPLQQFSSLPLESRGYFAHRPLFYWDRHALQLQVCTTMSVLIFNNRGREVNYSLHVLPQQSVSENKIDSQIEQQAKVLSKKNLVDAMYKQLAADKPIKILKDGGDFAACIVHPEDLVAGVSADNDPLGLYEMFSGFSSSQNINKQSLEMRMLYSLWFIASHLVKARAIMPQLLVNDADALQCAWVPASISPEVKELVTKVGLAVQGYEHFLFNRLDRQYYLHPQFLGEILLAPFIQSYLAWARNSVQRLAVADIINEENAPSDLAVIFSGLELPMSSLSSEDYELTGIRYRLENWLSAVNISTEQRYIPVLRLVDLGDPENYDETIFTQLADEIQAEAELTFAQQQEKVQKMKMTANEDTLNFIRQMNEDLAQEAHLEVDEESDADPAVEPDVSGEETAVTSTAGGGRWRRMRVARGASRVASRTAAKAQKVQDSSTQGVHVVEAEADASAAYASSAASAAHSVNAGMAGDDNEHVMQWGVGLELGFMGFEPEVYSNLNAKQEEYSNDIANTGFVPLRQIIADETFQQVRQYCISTIARISFLLPSLNKLFSSRFHVMVLPLNEIYHLLNVASSTLKMLGVRLVLPKSLTRLLQPAATMKLDVDKSDSKGSSPSFMTLQSMLNFQWQIAVGEHILNGDEFQLLMANAGQVVRFKDGFVYADVDMLRKIQDGYQKLQSMTTSNQQLLEAALTGSFENYDVVLSKQLRENLSRLLKTDEIALPQGLKEDIKGKLRQYQVRGYEWLVRNARIQLGSILADDMGLGKTLQVLMALLRFKEDGSLTSESPALVVVPTSLLKNWEHEVATYSEGLSVYTYYGAASDLKGVQSDIILTSYGTARTRIAELRKLHFGVLVIDEAQMIKSRTTELNKALSSLKADRFIAMSGTPVENRLLEYYSILDFVNRGLFGTEKSFKDRFSIPIERNRDINAVKRFKLLTAPFIMRRLKSDKNVINDLPDKIVSDQYCSLTPTQASLYQSVVDAKMKLLEQEEVSPANRRAIVLSLIQNLKAICNSPSQYSPNNPDLQADDSGKVERLLELLTEVMDNGGKVLVFTQSVIMGKYLQEIIGKQFKRTPAFLHGGLNPQERSELVDKFQNDAQERILLLSLRAAGTGLNLTAANTVIHFDLWWNPAVENQATDRAFRIGQKNTVMVYRFVCSHTFEERINEMIQSKRDLADLTVVSGENWIGSMSNRQLNDLFSLQEEEDA